MRIKLIGIKKSFGPVIANDDINLEVPSGTILGVLGENGAGKSTLMKILSGFIHADHGKIILDDTEIHINSPADAILAGIGMLHQDPLDFPSLKAIDNFIAGSHGTHVVDRFFPNRKEILAQFNNLKNEFGFSIDPNAYIDTLTVGERQQLEILRLLWLGVRILILDEPTTGISLTQKEKLFATLQQLSKTGKTIIFVSHKLEDVEGLCHRIAVLRRGKLIGDELPPYQTQSLVTMMFGKPITLPERLPSQFGDCLLELDNFEIDNRRVHTRAVSLHIRSGEVIGLAGMEGSGQLPFLRACAGMIRSSNGRIILSGIDITGKNYLTFREKGVTYIPASRIEEGLIPGLSLQEHFTLANYSHKFFISDRAYQKICQEQIENFNIKGTPSTPIETLSGGNQQRTLLALMQSNQRLILIEHPTRGLDVESAIDIWKKLKERCRQGASIIFISSDLDEISYYADRVLVFFSGNISAPMDAQKTQSDTLGQFIGGKGW